MLQCIDKLCYFFIQDSNQFVLPQVHHETKVGDFDASLYETQQVFYKSKDGTDIPMFLVHKKVINFAI